MRGENRKSQGSRENGAVIYKMLDLLLSTSESCMKEKPSSCVMSTGPAPRAGKVGEGGM